MQKSDFTVHLSPKEMIKMQELHLKFSTHSRNAIIKECINAYIIEETDHDLEINTLKRKLNMLFNQLNPDWKRKKSLPYHFDDEYITQANYYASITPNGGEE